MWGQMVPSRSVANHYPGRRFKEHVIHNPIQDVVTPEELAWLQSKLVTDTVQKLPETEAEEPPPGEDVPPGLEAKQEAGVDDQVPTKCGRWGKEPAPSPLICCPRFAATLQVTPPPTWLEGTRPTQGLVTELLPPPLLQPRWVPPPIHVLNLLRLSWVEEADSLPVSEHHGDFLGFWTLPVGLGGDSPFSAGGGGGGC